MHYAEPQPYEGSDLTEQGVDHQAGHPPVERRFHTRRDRDAGGLSTLNAEDDAFDIMLKGSWHRAVSTQQDQQGALPLPATLCRRVPRHEAQP